MRNVVMTGQEVFTRVHLCRGYILVWWEQISEHREGVYGYGLGVHAKHQIK